jgi:hypothetical protein
MTNRWLLGLLLVAASGGCMKKSAEAPPTSAPADYAMGPPADPGYAGMPMEESAPTMAAPEPVSADMDMKREAPARGARGRWGRRDRGEMASAPPGEQAGGGNNPEGTKAVADDQPEDFGRYIVYTAGMQVSVFNLEEAMRVAETLPETYGGYIASMSTGAFVLRIPSKRLREVMDAVGEMGVVENKSLTAQDVTDEWVDIESRLSALEKTHKQLLELLEKARTVQEALEVRHALDQISAELEVLKGRLRKLENLTSFSTLTLTLIERGPFTPTPSSNDPFYWVDSLGVESTEWK